MSPSTLTPSVGTHHQDTKTPSRPPTQTTKSEFVPIGLRKLGRRSNPKAAPPLRRFEPVSVGPPTWCCTRPLSEHPRKEDDQKASPQCRLSAPPGSNGPLGVLVSWWFVFRRAIPGIAFTLALLAGSTAEARLAVFVDGRVLKVEDAVLADDSIVLTLPGGGTLTVPATRIDRVVADEVASDLPVLELPACSPAWADEPLPKELPFRAEIADAARSANLNPWLLAALVQQESAFDPHAVSRAGARGLTQLMPAAAADQGVDNVWDPVENLRGGAAHLRRLLDRFGSLTLALAAYNAGAATVERAAGVPPYRETREFIRRITARFCPEGEAAPGPSVSSAATR